MNKISIIVKSDFNRLPLKEKIKIKELGRPLPELKMEQKTERRAENRTFTRRFSMEIYKKNNWICGCEVSNLLYCFPCVLFYNTACGSSDFSWARAGVKDLHHLPTKIKKHEESHGHINACMEFALLGKTNMIELSPCRQHIVDNNEKVRKNRYVLKRLISCIKFCSASELVLRGHDENEKSESRGIFRELIDFSAELDLTLREHLNNASVFKGTSNSIENEILDSMLAVCRNEISNQIKNSDFLAIQYDETADITNWCQMVIIFRYIFNGRIYENFWGFKQIKEKSAKGITKSIEEEIDPLILQTPQKLIAQSYDGANIMGGVQAHIKNKYPCAHYIHCYAHQLNLSMQKAVSQYAKVRLFFNNLSAIPAFFSNSSNRCNVLEEIVRQKLPNAAITGWNYNIGTVNSVYENREQLIDVFEEIEEKCAKSSTTNEASGLRRALEDPEFVFWQNHTQQDLYKPSRSPLPPTPSRYPFPGSPQLQPQVVVGQLAPPPPQQPPTLPPSNNQAPQQQQVQQPQQRYTIATASGPSLPQPSLPPPTGYRDTYRQHRISLLHPDYGGRSREVLLQGSGGGATAAAASTHHMDASMTAMGQQPFKKIRLQDHKEIQPLRIDTRDQPGSYNPQVEAISPTLPDHIQQEDQAFRTTKDELLQQIGKVDREIAKTESQITILRKKMQELEESASKPATKTEVEEDCQPKHQSLAQKIYAENRKKAQSAHATLDSLGPKVEWPIYNQPSDAPVYLENKRKQLAYKRRLLEYFKKRHVEKDTRNSHLIVTYSKMMQEWHRKVDKTESSSKRKTKEAKNREFFEKVFPELRKQREDKERFNRVGARIKSEADLEEIMDNLQEQVLEDKKMRSYAVIPPIMLDAKERKHVYQNNNGHILDMEAVHKSRQFLNIWTAAEKEIFKEKYLQHPKNFYLIASFLDKKSVADCVQYYYLSKKTENYKQLLKRSRQRTRHRPQKTTAGVDNLPPGVVTRHQKEQQALKTVAQQNYEGIDNNVTTSSSSVAGSITTFTVSSTNNNNGNNNATNNSSTALTPTSNSVTSSSSSPAPASTPSTVISNNNGGSATNVTSANTTALVMAKMDVMESGGEETKSESNNSEKKLLQDIVVKVENTSSNEGSNSDAVVGSIAIIKKEDIKKEDIVMVKKEDIVIKKEDSVTENYGSDQNFTPNTVVENKKKKERRKDKDNCQVETSEDECVDLIDKSSQGQCIVCGAQLGPQLQSRPLAPNQASLYGLREDQIPPSGRVCNTCRCKSVRSRYTHCPLPTCPNARGRVKRLRSFPQRLQELPQDVRDQLLAEFHVPSSVTKCCSACFNRIQRRLGLVEDWPEEEVNQLRNILSEVGANWQLVGERMNKTAPQVRSFYATNRKRLELESCLGDRKPTLTDEEESGSSTSSCEEPLRERHSSDTVSAESPPVNHEQPANPARKEDYDSSATETADEGQTPDNYQGSATITPVNPDGQARQNTSPLTVKDLMLNVIERSLKKPSGPQQPQLLLTSGMAPTISSILNDSNEVTIVSEYNLNNQPPRSQRNEISIAKLTPLIGATITAVQVPPQTTPVVQEPQSRDDLVVMQVQDGREPENLTLDLSIKKNRELPPPAHAKIQQIRPEPYMYHERKSPAVYSSRVLQPKLPSPKPANPKTGSITMGTPIINQPRYDGLLRQITPDPKMGSITQGTPIHVPSHMQDKRMYHEYFGKRPAQNVQTPQNANFAQYRQPYSVEQQLSRQIIMNDYITSQQMEKLGRRSEKPYYLSSPQHRTPPPAAQQTQQRQGVIQRHTRPHYPLPGHEALTSLVDVAVQQPSLPVPTAPHEGLGKTIADNILEQPHRFQMMQQQQLRQQQQQQQQQQRMEVERRYHHQQQQVRQQQAARNESSTLTAANLIDAIITHQINQSENAREVVSNSREPPRASDRLFQSFHREQPQPDNNGERSPSVISVDLDSDTMNKNLTVKELTDSVISHDFNTRPAYYTHQETLNEQWKRRLQQRDEKRSGTPQQQPQSQDERQIIRIAQSQKYPVEPVSPPENNHWQEQNYRRYPQQTQPQPHISALDYVKNRIVEVMRTEDDKKDTHSSHDRSDSPGEMVIDEEKHENDFQPQPHQPQPGFTYNYVKDNSTANDNARNEPEPLLDSKYEPLSDED